MTKFLEEPQIPEQKVRERRSNCGVGTSFVYGAHRMRPAKGARHGVECSYLPIVYALMLLDAKHFVHKAYGCFEDIQRAVKPSATGIDHSCRRHDDHRLRVGHTKTVANLRGTDGKMRTGATHDEGRSAGAVWHVRGLHSCLCPAR
eukprot:scaffold20842_cov33-Tisochrysis_lutea.AAC.3